MRFAFLTPEFVSDYSDGGGLGNATAKIARGLLDKGHDVELFVNSEMKPKVVLFDGIRVERVPSSEGNPLRRKKHRFMQRFLPNSFVRYDSELCVRADALAQAMERRHREKGFDVVHSADYLGVGYYVSRRIGRAHIIRISCPIDLYHQVDHRTDRAAVAQRALEFAAIQKADGCYAPSNFVAAHYSDLLGIPVGTIRTPRENTGETLVELPIRLPEKYLLFYGQLVPRKGIERLVDAMNYAFQNEPDLMLVIVGSGNPSYLGKILMPLRDYRSQIIVLYPLPHDQMMTVVKKAHAAVLPSLVDNLPNTAIECLSQGIPVIGPNGVSFDELVEDGITGRLVNIGKPEELGEAIIESWRGFVRYQKGFEWNSAVAKELSAEHSIPALVEYCRVRLTAARKIT